MAAFSGGVPSPQFTVAAYPSGFPPERIPRAKSFVVAVDVDRPSPGLNVSASAQDPAGTPTPTATPTPSPTPTPEEIAEAERKEKLRGILPKHPLLAFSAHQPERGIKYFKEAEKHGIEGIMPKRPPVLTCPASEAATG